MQEAASRVQRQAAASSGLQRTGPLQGHAPAGWLFRAWWMRPGGSSKQRAAASGSKQRAAASISSAGPCPSWMTSPASVDASRWQVSCTRGTLLGMLHCVLLLLQGLNATAAVAHVNVGDEAQGETRSVDSHAACRARRGRLPGTVQGCNSGGRRVPWFLRHRVATLLVRRFTSSSTRKPVPVVLSGGLLGKSAPGGTPPAWRRCSCFADIAPCDPHSLPILHWLTGRGLWQLCTG